MRSMPGERKALETAQKTLDELKEAGKPEVLGLTGGKEMGTPKVVMCAVGRSVCS